MAEKANFRELSEKELSTKRAELKSHMKDMRVERVIGSNFNLAEYKQAKKDIARINTLLTELGKSKEEN